MIERAPHKCATSSLFWALIDLAAPPLNSSRYSRTAIDVESVRVLGQVRKPQVCVGELILSATTYPFRYTVF